MTKPIDHHCRLCGGAGYVDDSQVWIREGRTDVCPECNGTGIAARIGPGATLALASLISAGLWLGAWCATGNLAQATVATLCILAAMLALGVFVANLDR